jgi:hypothetical protein
MAAWLIVFRTCAGGAETGSRHAEAIEDLLTHEIFPRFSGDLLGHVAGDGEACVGVDELFAGDRFGRLGRNA